MVQTGIIFPSELYDSQIFFNLIVNNFNHFINILPDVLSVNNSLQIFLKVIVNKNLGFCQTNIELDASNGQLPNYINTKE